MRRFVVIALVNVVLAGAAATYSTASTSHPRAAEPLVISAVSFRGNDAALYPGGSVDVKATLTNDTASRLRVDAVTIEASVANLPRGCLSTWFRFARHTGQAAVVAGSGGTATVRGTLTLADTAADQSACAGAAPVLTLHAFVTRPARRAWDAGSRAPGTPS